LKPFVSMPVCVDARGLTEGLRTSCAAESGRLDTRKRDAKTAGLQDQWKWALYRDGYRMPTI
jgi:hypothetical protein